MAIGISGCNKLENELTTGAEITLSSQAEVDRYKAHGDILKLTISGESITDISALEVQQVKNLIIENTGIENLRLPALNAVTVMMHITGNQRLLSLDGLENLQFVNGSLIIENNDALEDISGLLGLKVFTGNLTIAENDRLGKNEVCLNDGIGLCAVKSLVESGVFTGTVTLASNHPEAPTSVQAIGQIPGDDVISYTLRSKADIEAFAPLSDTVLNLTVTGTEINSSLLNMLSSKIKWVKGTLLIENTNMVDTEGFFDKVHCDGSIILRNNPQLFNPQGFRGYKHIKGDLIIENCPSLAYWWSAAGDVGFSGIERIDGSLIVNPAIGVESGGASFVKLNHVGGDFILVGSPDAGNIWNLDTWYSVGGGIKYIGGDLVFSNHHTVNGLSGFQALEYLGGDVSIMDNGAGNNQEIPLMNTSDQVGFCLIKTLLDNGVMKKENPTIQLRVKPGAPLIDINTLAACQSSN
ncbi:hypothetical protein [Parapedobacter sp. 2B3]|uniref:hypothetical protein n=1 Tax=Parapedobacter sp. 2B3 TaxID=3342381 RepID=UPI0035B62C9C